jgi:hypothetical protein
MLFKCALVGSGHSAQVLSDILLGNSVVFIGCEAG